MGADYVVNTLTNKRIENEAQMAREDLRARERERCEKEHTVKKELAIGTIIFE